MFVCWFTGGFLHLFFLFILSISPFQTAPLRPIPSRIVLLVPCVCYLFCVKRLIFVLLFCCLFDCSFIHFLYLRNLSSIYLSPFLYQNFFFVSVIIDIFLYWIKETPLFLFRLYNPHFNPSIHPLNGQRAKFPRVARSARQTTTSPLP